MQLFFCEKFDSGDRPSLIHQIPTVTNVRLSSCLLSVVAVNHAVNASKKFNIFSSSIAVASWALAMGSLSPTLFLFLQRPQLVPLLRPPATCCQGCWETLQRKLDFDRLEVASHEQFLGDAPSAFANCYDHGFVCPSVCSKCALRETVGAKMKLGRTRHGWSRSTAPKMVGTFTSETTDTLPHDRSCNRYAMFISLTGNDVICSF